VLVLPSVALFLPFVHLLRKIVASGLKVLALVGPFNDDDIVTGELTFQVDDLDHEKAVLLLPTVALFLPSVHLHVEEANSLFQLVDLWSMTIDDDLVLLDGLHVNRDFAVAVVVLGLHLVELLLPHVAVRFPMLALSSQDNQLLLHLVEFDLHMEKGVVVLLEGVVFSIKLFEMLSGLRKLVLSHGVLIGVHLLELSVLLDFHPKSLDLNVEVSVGLLLLEMLLLPHDDLLSEGVLLVNVHADGGGEFRDSHLELLLHFLDEEFLLHTVFGEMGSV